MLDCCHVWKEAQTSTFMLVECPRQTGEDNVQRQSKALGRTPSLTTWERMTGRAHKNSHSQPGFPTYCVYLNSLHFWNYFSYSSSLKDNKFYKFHRYVWFNREDRLQRYLYVRRKVRGGALQSPVRQQRNQLKRLLLGPWLQEMCYMQKGLICPGRCQSECQVKAEARLGKKLQFCLLPGRSSKVPAAMVLPLMHKVCASALQ